MHRFYLPPEKCGKTIQLEDREAHHAMHVLRLRTGDEAQILNGCGDIYDCKVASVHKSTIQLQVIQQRSFPLPHWRITLFQALPKGKAFDLIVEKAAELGAYRVIPIVSERVVGSFENNERKWERWQLTAIDAIKQCGSAWLPRIDKPLDLNAATNLTRDLDLTLLASLYSGSKHPRELLQPVKLDSPINIGIWVGPEGDFSPEEIATLIKAGAQPITLGNLILRAETAALYCLSVINYEMQARSLRF